MEPLAVVKPVVELVISAEEFVSATEPSAKPIFEKHFAAHPRPPTPELSAEVRELQAQQALSKQQYAAAMTRADRLAELKERMCAENSRLYEAYRKLLESRRQAALASRFRSPTDTRPSVALMVWDGVDAACVRELRHALVGVCGWSMVVAKVHPGAPVSAAYTTEYAAQAAANVAAGCVFELEANASFLAFHVIIVPAGSPEIAHSLKLRSLCTTTCHALRHVAVVGSENVGALLGPAGVLRHPERRRHAGPEELGGTPGEGVVVDMCVITAATAADTPALARAVVAAVMDEAAADRRLGPLSAAPAHSPGDAAARAASV